MEGDDEKYEYVLNETGRLYYGAAQYVNPMAWNFGQVRFDTSLFHVLWDGEGGRGSPRTCLKRHSFLTYIFGKLLSYFNSCSFFR